MDNSNYSNREGESDSVAGCLDEKCIRADSGGGTPANNGALSGDDCKTVITGHSDAETVSVSDHAVTLDQGGVEEPGNQMTAMPIQRCTTSHDPESITTALAAAASMDSMQPRECQTRSLTQLFHLTATLNEHFRLSLTRMERKLDEVVRKVSEMEEVMQEWKEGQRSNDTGEAGRQEEEKEEEGKEVVQEESKNESDGEEYEAHSWEKWLPRRARQVRNRIEQSRAEERKTSIERNESEAGEESDAHAVTRTGNLVVHGTQTGQETHSKTMQDTFRLNESEKKEIKNLHDVTTQTHVNAASDVGQHTPPRSAQTYHIKI